MIKLPVLDETEWYIHEVRNLFVRKDTLPENRYNTFKKNIKIIEMELQKLNINENSFSNYNSNLTLFENFIIAPYEDLEGIMNSNIIGKEHIFKQPIKYKDKSGNEQVKYENEEPWEIIYKKYDKLIVNKVNIKLVQKYNIKCCPYCNENYIHNREKNSMAQLDHFYPRSKYPIFAICLYNLVPSCSVCNHIKTTKDVKVSPHNHKYDFSELKLSYEPLCMNYLNNDDYIEIKFTFKNEQGQFSQDMKINLSEMKIEESYKAHRDYVREILKKALIYNDSVKNSLLRNYPELFHDEEELTQIIFGNYISEDALLKRPLSKLTMDLLSELNII